MAMSVPSISTSTLVIAARQGVSVQVIGNSLSFTGIPNAVKIIDVKDNEARRLAELYLHDLDLRFAQDSLGALSAPDVSPHVRESLWRSCLVHFFKCFDAGESRFSLQPSKVYKKDAARMSAFNHLKAVRNKHMVHDVNAYAQSYVAAVLNDANSSPSVAALLKCAAVLQTLDQTQHANFQQLLNKAADWVTAQSQTLYDAISRKLEATP
jgi:hypothetical protein